MLRRGSAFIVVGALLPGCMAPDGDPGVRRTSWERGPDPVGEAADAIRDGYVHPGDPAAVGIVTSRGSVCSGSLIAPNLVLTARHCVSDTYEDDQGVRCLHTRFGPAWDARDIYVTTHAQFTQDFSAYRRGSDVITLPVDDKLCGQDVALIVLEELVPPEEAVPYVPRVDAPLVAGEEYHAIGFGATNDAGSGAGVRRRRDALFVECVEEGCGVRGDITTTEWVGDQGICSGDSGGPAIDLLNRVVGITSRGTYGCDDPVYGSTHAWGAWLKEQGLLAAQIGGYEPLPWMTGWPTDPQYDHPVGGACVDPAACTSGVCFAETCTRACNEAAPCPAGFLCEVPEGMESPLCVPEPPPEDDEDGEDEGDGASASDGGDAATGEAPACAVSTPGDDPVTPVPWIVGLAVGALAVARRRTGRRGA